jgi:hypothetical protein
MHLDLKNGSVLENEALARRHTRERQDCERREQRLAAAPVRNLPLAAP